MHRTSSAAASFSFIDFSGVLLRPHGGNLLPAIDLRQRSAHELRLIAVRQPIGVAERCNALLVGQHAAGACPIGTPHAAVDAERVDDPQHRVQMSSYGKGSRERVQAPLIFTRTFG